MLVDLLLVLPLVVLATMETVEVLHHGSLFAGLREWLKSAGGPLCPFCLTPWLAGIVYLLAAAAIVAGREGHDGLSIVLLLPVYALAAARAANLGNDLLYRFCRTPRPTIEEDETAESKTSFEYQCQCRGLRPATEEPNGTDPAP